MMICATLLNGVWLLPPQGGVPHRWRLSESRSMRPQRLCCKQFAFCLFGELSDSSCMMHCQCKQFAALCLARTMRAKPWHEVCSGAVGATLARWHLLLVCCLQSFPSAHQETCCLTSAEVTLQGDPQHAHHKQQVLYLNFDLASGLFAHHVLVA
jgi:hypothetical protein